MMCYRDRRFCPFNDCTKFNTCANAYTDQVQAAAERWWVSGGGIAENTPVDLWADKPQCYKEKP